MESSLSVVQPGVATDLVTLFLKIGLECGGVPSELSVLIISDLPACVATNHRLSLKDVYSFCQEEESLSL